MFKMTIYKVSNVPLDKIVFGKLKKGIDTYMIPTYIRESSDSPSEKLSVQLNDMTFDKGGFENEYIDVCSKDERAYEMIKKVETYVLNELKSKRTTWFGNQDIDDVFLESGMTSTAIKDSKFRLRVMDDVQIYDANREVKTTNEVTPNTPCHLIIQMAGIWFTPGRWGVTWKVIQVKLKHQRVSASKPKQCMFSDDEDDNDEDLSVLKVPPIL